MAHTSPPPSKVVVKTEEEKDAVEALVELCALLREEVAGHVGGHHVSPVGFQAPPIAEAPFSMVVASPMVTSLSVTCAIPMVPAVAIVSPIWLSPTNILSTLHPKGSQQQPLSAASALEEKDKKKKRVRGGGTAGPGRNSAKQRGLTHIARQRKNDHHVHMKPGRAVREAVRQVYADQMEGCALLAKQLLLESKKEEASPTITIQNMFPIRFMEVLTTKLVDFATEAFKADKKKEGAILCLLALDKCKWSLEPQEYKDAVRKKALDTLGEVEKDPVFVVHDVVNELVSCVEQQWWDESGANSGDHSKKEPHWRQLKQFQFYQDTFAANHPHTPGAPKRPKTAGKSSSMWTDCFQSMRSSKTVEEMLNNKINGNIRNAGITRNPKKTDDPKWAQIGTYASKEWACNWDVFTYENWKKFG